MSIRATQRGLTRELSFEDYLREKPANLDVKWGKGVSPSSLFDTIGVDISSLLETTSAVASGAQLIVDLLREAVDFVITLVARPIVSIFEGLVLAIKQVVTAFANIFTGLSANVLYHFPETPKTRRKPSEVLYDVGMAYLDDKDANRPITLDDVYGVSLVVTFNFFNDQAVRQKLAEIKRRFQGIQGDATSFTEALQKFGNQDENWKSPIPEKGSSGMKPDFEASISLVDAPAFKKLVDTLLQFSSTLDKTRGLAQKFQSVLSLVETKLNLIQRQANELVTALNTAIAMLNFEDAAGIFSVKGSGEAIDFAKAIINAPLHPTYPKSDLAEDIGNEYKAKGLPSPINKRLGQETMFGCAFVLHLQVPNVEENISVIERLLDAMFTEENPAFREETYRKAGDRITSVTDRIERVVGS